MEIKRDRYLERLTRLQFKGGVKIITGLRRSGKSYLLFTLFRNHLLESGVSEGNIISIALDSIENKHLRSADALYREVISRITDGSDYYVMIDEIQFAEDFVDFVNGLIGRKNVDLYITGSNSKFLSSDLVTEFRGRGTDINVRPLSFSEYRSAVDLDDRSAWHSYLTYGGLPESVDLIDEDKASYLSDLIRLVYIRDIIERKKVRMPDVLDAVFDVLSSAVGSLTNPNRISDIMQGRRIKVDGETISSYILHLEDAFLFERSRRFDLKGSEYIDTPSKYYAVDLGLRNAKLGFRQNEYNHLMENAIYNELRYRGYSVDVGVIGIRDYKDGKREYKQLEIDFVANKGSDRIYLQSAYRMDEPDKQKQELRPFLKMNDAFRKILLVGDDVPPHVNDKGITIMNVIDFMKDSGSLERI
ncbi:MAG: ATP-binding protein [Candidatus Methanomethylophilaceae archaeon]|nr:ATP-binding protein [Candidatus Methanomethylophilaceae archaeon]